MPYNANPRMPKTCDGCIYKADIGASYAVCNYLIATNQKRPCPPENCTCYQSDNPTPTINKLSDDTISEMRRMRRSGMTLNAIADAIGCTVLTVSKYTKCIDVEIDRSKISREQRDEIIRLRNEGLSIHEINRRTGVSRGTISKYVKGIEVPATEGEFEVRKGGKPTQEIIDKLVDMRERGMSISQIEKATGISHTTIMRYTSAKNPAAAATAAGEESGNCEKLSGDIVSPNPENVKPLAEPTETLAESSDKPDVKTYEDSPETPAEETTGGTAEKSVPSAVVEACLARIEHLSSEIGNEMVVIRNWEQEIKELREFLGLEEWE